MKDSGANAMVSKPQKQKTAQQLCNELYNKVSMPLSDAWISDDAGEIEAREYVKLVRSQLWALDEARAEFKAFLRRNRKYDRGDAA